MKIRLTVWVGNTGVTPRAVTVTTPAGCPPTQLHSDAVAALLSDALGVPGDALCARGQILDSDALLGLPPLLDGGSVRLVERALWTPPRSTAAVAATELSVISGPDAGHALALTAGVHTVGRAEADLTVADPSLSRRHLRLVVGPEGVKATDLDSENGTTIDGGGSVDAATVIGVGSVLSLGATKLMLRPSRLRPATTTPRGDGTLLLARTTLPIAQTPTVGIEVPSEPEPPPARRIPWPAVLVPLPIAAVLAWLFGPHFILLAVMSPLMVLGTYVSDRFGGRRAHRAAVLQHSEQVAACVRRRGEALAAERRWRERTYPDLAAIARAAATPAPLLWSRSPSCGLILRLGRATVTSGVTWVDTSGARRVQLVDAPFTLDLSRYAGLTVSGPLASGVVDGLIGQLCVLHSPRDLAVWTDSSRWAGAPHIRHAQAATLVADAVATLTRRTETPQPGSARDPAIRTVVALHAASLSTRDVEVLAAVIDDAGSAGLHLLLAGDGPALLPDHLATTASGAATLTRPGHEATDLTVDSAADQWTGRVVGALTPLRDSTAAGGLPTAVTLIDALARCDVSADAQSIAAAWSHSDGGAWLTLGIDKDGPHRLDLSAAGPHALVAGTTGSGKSELLRTLVTSLAAAHPPEDLAVVLVDYKGGSAFAGLEALPHVVGLVTDLDGGLTARALASLRAEIHRREELFAHCGAADLPGYRRRSDRAASPMPHLGRLVIVVDEFRALAEELPDFVAGLVRLAAVGRSLGIHLVLATQRPAGVVTADMRANLGLRIALRVRDRADSVDVIESDAAAGLPRDTPGRALLRCGVEPMQTIQVATVAAAEVAEPVTVELAWSDGSVTSRRYPVSGSAERVSLVSCIIAAARQTRRQAPPSPWLPPLADHIRWCSEHPPSAWAIADDPARQRQDPVALDLASMPHTAVAGAVGSGRSTTLLAMVAAALATSGQSTHLYVLADPHGPLAALATVPNTGAVIDRSDPAQAAAFVDRLTTAVRARAAAPVADTLLVVVDGWDVLTDACDPLDHGALTDRFLAALREGYAVGTRAILSGDRSVLVGRVGRTATDRLLLRPADPSDLALVGVPAKSIPSTWPPGRARRLRDGLELQVLLRPVEAMAQPPDSPPWRLIALPARLDVGTLTTPPTGGLAVGVSSESEAAITVGLPGQRRVLVVGSSGAGRTSTLAVIGIQAARAGRSLCLVDTADSCLHTMLSDVGVQVERLGWDDYDRLVALRRANPALAVLADDVDRHTESPLVPVLVQISDLCERDGGLLAVAGDSSAMNIRARGVGAAVARGRFGIVLGAPTTLDGDLLGTRLPKVRDVVPGRGWLVTQRRAVPVQVADGSGVGHPAKRPNAPSTRPRPR